MIFSFKLKSPGNILEITHAASVEIDEYQFAALTVNNSIRKSSSMWAQEYFVAVQESERYYDLVEPTATFQVEVYDTEMHAIGILDKNYTHKSTEVRWC